MKKFALVLSGGGFKGAFQIGALKYLNENWAQIHSGQNKMKFDIIGGVSVGSLNGALMATDQFESLLKIWEDVGENGVEEIYTSDFIDTQSNSEDLKFKIDAEKLVAKFLPDFKINISFWQGLQLLFSKNSRDRLFSDVLQSAVAEIGPNFQNFKSLADNAPLKSKLEALLKIDKVKETIYSCGFVSLDDGNYYSVKSSEFNSDSDFQAGVLASSAMPIIWEPIPAIGTQNKNIKNTVDGGIKNVSPLGDVIDEINKQGDAGDFTIVIINCNTHDLEPANYDQSNIAEIALRSLTDLAISEIFNNDIKEFLRINDILTQIGDDKIIYNYDFRKESRTNEQLKTFKAIIIQPDLGVLGDSLVSTKALYKRRYAHGREKAIEAINKLKMSGKDFKTILT
ncbi:MAG: patatin-like phospholipase family protein [Cyclobacteriaceae bacterium]